MAIHCEFIDLIIPISNIDKVYVGGFQKFKSDNIGMFSKRLWHDDFLFRDGAMDGMGMRMLCKEWEERGLVGVVDVDGHRQWKDFCVVESLFGGPTLPCDWIEVDRKSMSVFLKGQPRGQILGPIR
jgi:hypothetical protein